MSERVILGIKFQAKVNNPWLGLVDAIAEDVDGKINQITQENFCSTKQVFITSGYENIESKFRQGELFRIFVDISQNQSGDCKYKATGDHVEKLKPNDIAEIIHAELPDRNIRRLSVDLLPCTKYIFIQNNAGDCYGPFDWEERSGPQEDELNIELKIIVGGKIGELTGKTRQIYKISSEVISLNQIFCNSRIGAKYIIGNVSSIIFGQKLEDYANDKEVVDYVVSMISGTAGKIIDRKNLETLCSFALKNRQAIHPLNKNRIGIFRKIIETNVDILGGVNQCLETFLKNESGEKIIEDYVQANRGKYIDKFKADKDIEANSNIKIKQDELIQIKKDIENSRRERTILNDEIEVRRKSLERDVIADQKAILEKISKEHQEKISAMNADEEKAKNRLNEINSRIGRLSELDNIQDLVKSEKVIRNFIQQEIEEKKKERDAVLEESRKTEDEIRKKLRGMKPYVDHLNGSFNSEKLELPDIKIICPDFSYKEEIYAQRSVIESIRNRFASKGRSLDDQEVANLLISTQQSFITFFAGLPGVGKTSQCKLMAQVQGLEKRLLTISVARGWTSIKDIVGFHNPLNDRFQPASTGMYEFLQAIDKEVKDTTIYNPMSYILLDEANLSSIEHYWSAFMGMADAATSQILSVGKKEDSLIIPRSLRFLATINYDGTTEPLSPRILNRAGVIVMRPGEVSSRQNIDESVLQALPISSENMDALFGLFHEPPKFENDEKIALEEISKVLGDPIIDHGRSIHISQRKINAIQQYCGRARPIMRSTGKEITALDWAIMQHILPQSTGHGNKFKKRLLELKKRLEDHDLEMSAKYLDQMILSGENDLHSYEFFCW